VNSSSVAVSVRTSRLVLGAMYHFKSSLLDTRSLIRVTRHSIMRSHFSGPAVCLLMMLMNWAISQRHSLTLLSIRCVVKPPLSCQILIVSAVYWLPRILAFSARTRSCSVGIWIVLPSVMTDFCNQKASLCILGSEWWSIIEWWILNA